MLRLHSQHSFKCPRPLLSRMSSAGRTFPPSSHEITPLSTARELQPHAPLLNRRRVQRITFSFDTRKSTNSTVGREMIDGRNRRKVSLLYKCAVHNVDGSKTTVREEGRA